MKGGKYEVGGIVSPRALNPVLQKIWRSRSRLTVVYAVRVLPCSGLWCSGPALRWFVRFGFRPAVVCVVQVLPYSGGCRASDFIRGI